MKTTFLQIPPQNYRRRLESLCQYLQEQTLSGAVLFEREYILYYTGFAFIPTERPLAVVLNDRAETALVEALRGASREARAAAGLALSACGTRESVPALLDALAEAPEDLVRRVQLAGPQAVHHLDRLVVVAVACQRQFDDLLDAVAAEDDRDARRCVLLAVLAVEHADAGRQHGGGSGCRYRDLRRRVVGRYF